MFFIFPTSCDAPLYHLPIATVAFILLNIAAFVGVLTGHINEFDGWMLEYGTGLHPMQWFTSPFLHAGVSHLLTNLFFLWIFGLVVEGKVGWAKFASFYLLIAAGESALEQVLMLSASNAGNYSLGASAAVYGLMAIAFVWAPLNEITFSWFAFFYFRPFTGSFDVPVMMVAVFYISIDLLLFFLGGGTGASAWHLLGALMGLGIGFVMLNRKLVDCENWDLVAYWKGEHGANAPKPEDRPLTEAEIAAQRDAKNSEALNRFDAFLEIGQSDQALDVVRRAQDLGRPLELDCPQLMKLIVGLHKLERWEDSAPLMAERIQRFPDGAALVELKLAHICVAALESPAKAIEILQQIDPLQLDEKQRAQRKKLAAVARQKIKEGTVEFDTAW